MQMRWDRGWDWHPPEDLRAPVLPLTLAAGCQRGPRRRFLAQPPVPVASPVAPSFLVAGLLGSKERVCQENEVQVHGIFKT